MNGKTLDISTARKTWPALSENAFLRYFNFVALYVAQGIPEGMTYFGIPAWMAMNGKTVSEIGAFVTVVGIPWSFKFIVAPMMDRFSYLPMGRRRPWVLFGQLGLIASFVGIALVPDPLNNLGLFMVAGFFISFFGAFQDVATDGMAVDIVPVQQQARANGLMWGSKTIGISTSLAVGTFLISMYGFSIAILSLSVVVCLIMLIPLSLRERPGEKLLPWSNGEASSETKKMQLQSWSVIFRSLFKVFSLRNSLILSIIVYFSGMAFNFMNTLISVFTIQAVGWTDQLYSRVGAVSQMTGGLAGMFVGGFLIDRFGKVRMLTIYYITLIVMVSGMAFLKVYWGNYIFTAGYIIVYNILYVFSTIGIFAAAMKFCWKKVSASQFTLYMTIANLGYISGSAAIGPLRDNFSWEYTILAFSVMLTVSLVTLQFIRTNNHLNKLIDLENIDHGSEKV